MVLEKSSDSIEDNFKISLKIKLISENWLKINLEIFSKMPENCLKSDSYPKSSKYYN